MLRNFRMVIVAVLAGAMLLGAAPARAQDPSSITIPSLELEQADVREALRALFKMVGSDFNIAPEVQGTVTVRLRNVPFDVALQNILRQVDATYRVEGGQYMIVKRPEPAPITSQGPQFEPTTPGSNKVYRRIKIMRADPQLVFTLLRGVLNPNLPPELSRSTGGSIGGGGGGGGGGVGGGAVGGGGVGGFGGGGGAGGAGGGGGRGGGGAGGGAGF